LTCRPQITSVQAYRELEFHQFSRRDPAEHRAGPPAGTFHPRYRLELLQHPTYILLGMIIQRVTHHSWENEVTRRIIIPLGLRHNLRARGTSTPAAPAARHRLPVL